MSMHVNIAGNNILWAIMPNHFHLSGDSFQKNYSNILGICKYSYRDTKQTT